MNARTLLRGLLLMASFVALGYLLEFSHLGSLLSKGWIDSAVRGQGLHGELLFLGVGLLATAVGLPRQLVSFLGGYAFGFSAGLVLGLAASVLGCLVAFLYARWLGRALVASRFPHRVERLDAFIRRHPFTMTLLIRLLPFGSNLATNLMAGVSSVRATPFVAGSALGYVPQTLVFALVGSGISVDPVLRIGLGVVLFLVSGALGAWLYRRHRRAAPAADDAGLDIVLGDEEVSR